MADDEDPLVPGYFAVEFQNQIAGVFESASGMDITIAPVSNYGTKDGKEEYHVQPGRPSYNQIMLGRGITKNQDMWKWRQLVEDGKIKDARKNGTISLYSRDDKKIASYDFVNGWPSSLSNPSLTAGGNTIAMEQFTIEHEGCERKS
jgi:phage tail-like protein